ncbi:MAG: DEAD/DEAH box helicase family protein [Propionibacteriaceae bacterium]|nr:DEAD/DEAH box helicase family protein [Propionibacteriaceae bacterium]
MSLPSYPLPAEARARVLIDAQLGRAGWSVQDRQGLNLFAARGVAVREKVMESGHGRADYILYVDKRVVGVIEAKPEGTPLRGVEWQSAMYATGLSEADYKRAVVRGDRLPFVFEASGSETHFTNGFDPKPRARRVFNFPRPETVARWIREAETDGAWPTWRAKTQVMAPLIEEGLRPAQIKAVRGLERALAEQRFDRALIQMAAGAGKTFTAITSCYRLLRHGGFNRVLLLVDRNNLADQALAEFSNYRLPNDGRRFTEVYGVDKLTGAGMLSSSSVVISTIQRVYSVLRGQEVGLEDDPNLDQYVPDAPVTVEYNPDLPPESFDLVIVDEAHRSIYGVWRGVLEYFDSYVVGLTATPGKQTFAFFRQNLISEYTYPQSVADGVNVDFDLYRIKTEISEKGSKIEAGTVVPKVDRRTRVERLETLDDDVEYGKGQLDRAVTAKSQIRLVLETFRDRLFTEIFPGRSTVPKTLIFAKDDAHAEEIVACLREVFGQGNEFCAKITYTARNAKEQLQAFRTSPTLRVAVTVDMIATGTDVKPLECVFFMRDVRSAQYFEQMKGRGARTIAPADFQSVTPDATRKTRFVLVDAVGVTEHAFVEPPLNRQKSVSLGRLLDKAAALTITENETATLASRLAKLELQLTAAERQELDGVAGRPVKQIIRALVDAIDPDERAKAIAARPDTNPGKIVGDLIEEAVKPLASNPELRSRILELCSVHDRIIDEVSADELVDAHGVVDTARAKSIVDSWRSYLDEHRDQITAIQVIEESRRLPAVRAPGAPSQIPSRARNDVRVSFTDIKELAERIARPPRNWTPDVIWAAYEQVENGKVRHSAAHTLTDLVSLLRFTLGLDAELVPYADQVRARYTGWLSQQSDRGVVFTAAQRWWLDRMAEVIAAGAGVTTEDLDESPFIERGGVDGILSVFGDQAEGIIEALNRQVAA